ncbi:hypothetical protein [Leptolyngbya sp. 7M]|uniref:hypothetical protein n=1 Tax=Leptolyngbya sp. 7M TaxID=2812896 RepID=UPI001B8C2DA0|nr:hypothetical protein [Leptolyngbya sp. 7M]QYO68919.1 hypothetical protein JVX88_35895 [Leptolyngbya sp. 7M]
MLYPTSRTELAKEQERLAKEQERLAKEQAQRAEEQAQAQLLQAARNLLATGMPAEQVVALLSLSEAQVQELHSSD